MSATDIARQKYLKLMTQVEDLEDRVAALEKQPAAVAQAELASLRELLAAARTELTRVSDGCGVPHAH